MAKQLVRDVMTSNPKTIKSGDTLQHAAEMMRDAAIGDLIVMDNSHVEGIVTDRDIVVRAVADGADPKAAHVRDVCSKAVVTVTPDSPVDEAIRIMRERAIRRLPVVQGEKPVGVVSLGDLAVERDSNSALADISAADPND